MAAFKWAHYQRDETAVVSRNFDIFEDLSNTNFISSESDDQTSTLETSGSEATTTETLSISTYDNRPSVINHIGTQHDSISITSAISEYIGDMIDRGHLLVLGLGLIILVTFCGNVLVCLSVIKVRKLRHPSNYLLVSLAISDLCVACAVMPFGVYQSINDNWQLGTLLCNVYVVSDLTSCTASILNLCVISIDRYFAITRPLTYCMKRTTRLMLMLIAFVWILACLISVPPLLISGNEYGTVEEPRCEVSQSVWYQLYATLFSFYIPLCVMIFIYYNIYTAAKKVIKAEQRATTGLQVNTNLNHQNNINGNHNNSTSNSNNSTSNNLCINMKERKASITLGFIMTAFTVCWLPFFIIAIMRPFSPTVNNLPREFVLLTLWLGYANSLLNPIIYVTFHHDFRNAFKHLLCFRCLTINERIRKDEYKSQYG